MVAQGGTRLHIDLNDLRTYDEQQRAQRGAEYESICDGLLQGPAERLPAYEAQLKALVEEENPSYGKDAKQLTDRDFHIGVEGSFGSNHVSPRELRSPLLAQLVCLEGIVTKAAQMKPKVCSSCLELYRSMRLILALSGGEECTLLPCNAAEHRAGVPRCHILPGNADWIYIPNQRRQWQSARDRIWSFKIL